jgi:hypothetical protein
LPPSDTTAVSSACGPELGTPFSPFMMTLLATQVKNYDSDTASIPIALAHSNRKSESYTTVRDDREVALI